MLDTPRQTFVVGDIHGRLGVLENALAEIERRASGGTVVFLGNYAQRGSQGRLVVDRLMNGPPAGWRWVCLMGCQEDALVSAWTSHGPGGPSMPSYGQRTPATIDYGPVPEAQLHWLARLPLAHKDEHRVYAHAALDDAFSVTNQPVEIVLHRAYDDNDRSGYLNKHLVHGHRASTLVSAGDRTALECFETAPHELLVARFDDNVAGPPVATFAVEASSVRSIDRSTPRVVNHAARAEQEVRSLRSAIANEVSQLERLQGTLAALPMLVESHEGATATYHHRLSVLERERRRARPV